jgi:hypothetical protein
MEPNDYSRRTSTITIPAFITMFRSEYNAELQRYRTTTTDYA